MACPTCSETFQLEFMDSVRKVWHCPRCGTMQSEFVDHTETTVPRLVERCRKFGETLGPAWGALWKRLGIAEAINIPENRS